MHLDGVDDELGGGSCAPSPARFELQEDPSFWKDNNVQVVIRIRPLSGSEVSLQGQKRCVRQDSSQSVTWIGHPESRFTFDLVTDEHVTQEDMFKVAGVPMVENCIAGYNSCMFAYGQTGSGKTHTMLGDIENGTRRNNMNCGITPRVFEHLFTRIQKEKELRRDEKLRFICKCSFLEIYNEQILDLLNPNSVNLQVHRLQSRGADIPHYAFNFCSFDGLTQKNIQYKPLLDLIGVISEISPYDLAGPKSQKKNRKIRIRNLDEQEQQIVLWDQQGESFDEKHVLDKSKEGIVVVVFAGLTVSKFSGKFEASSSSATRVYMGLDCPEITGYQTSYKWGAPHLELKLARTPQLVALNKSDELKTIQEILQQPIESFEGGKVFHCIAEVKAIIQSINWYYKACKRCKTGYNIISDAPRCNCTFPIQSPEYKLALTIEDNSGTMDCIAFYTVADDLVECSALQAFQNLQIKPDNHPAALKKAIGKKRLFHIAISRASSSNNSIKYILKRSFTADNQVTATTDETTSKVAHSQEQEQEVDHAAAATTPNQTIESTSTESSNSQAKRKLDFDQADPIENQGKQPKKQ